MRNNIVDIFRGEDSPTEPISLIQAKAHLYVTYNDDDTMISAMIIAARKAIENYCNISIVQQTIFLTADLYNEWELPYGPVTQIISVETRAQSQGSGPAQYSGATSNWQTDGVQFLSFRPAGFWAWDWGVPFPRNRDCWFEYRYKITYTAEWVSPPNDLLNAVLAQIAFLYENRGDGNVRYVAEVAQAGACELAKNLANPYVRLLWL